MKRLINKKSMFLKFYSDKSGLSVVISTILLIAIGIVLAGIVIFVLRAVVLRQTETLESCPSVLKESIFIGYSSSCSICGELQFALVIKDNSIEKIRVALTKNSENTKTFDISNGSVIPFVENFLWGNESSGLEFPIIDNPKVYIVNVSGLFNSSLLSLDNYTIQIAPVVDKHVCDVYVKSSLSKCSLQNTCSSNYLGYRCTSNASNCLESSMAPETYDCASGEFCCKRKYSSGEVFFVLGYCGDSICNGNETYATCPSDCLSTCGDGNCAFGENCSSCPFDCGICCGNGIIDESETCDDGNILNGDGCSNLCGIESGWECQGEPSNCVEIGGSSCVGLGGACEWLPCHSGSESLTQLDCGFLKLCCRDFCGNGVCEPGEGETFTTCPIDCKKALRETCTAGTECLSGYCYVDEDLDRYAPASGAKKCKQYSQLTGVDCYDSNANAKPGQTQYFTVHRGDGSYDYNCDGNVWKDPFYCYDWTYCFRNGIPCGGSCGGNYIWADMGGPAISCGQTVESVCCEYTYYSSSNPCKTTTETSCIPINKCSSYGGVINTKVSGSATHTCRCI